MQPKSTEQIYDEKYPIKDFNKVIYSFTTEEITKMQSYDTIIQIGALAELLINRYVQTDPLVRLGVKNTQDTAITYDIPTRKLIIWFPKVICSICNNRRGTQSYKERIYCDACLADMQVGEKLVNKEPKKEIKK